MCNRIKKVQNSKTVRCAKQIGCAKNSIWDLINISITGGMRGMCNGLYWVCTHSGNMDDENMNVLLFFYR